MHVGDGVYGYEDSKGSPRTMDSVSHTDIGLNVKPQYSV